MNKINIIIVEDESIIALNLKESLIDLNYSVCGIAPNRCKLMRILDKGIVPDIILMDINLKSNNSGIDIAKELKKTHSNVPIIFLTANSDVNIIKDTTDTVSYGYIIKPYKLHNLQASIELSIEKHKQHNDEISELNELKNKRDILEDIVEDKKTINKRVLTLIFPYTYDREKKYLFLDSKVINLTKKETMFIDLLCENPNSYVPQELIESIIWPDDPAGYNAFRSLIFRLRNKISKDLIINKKSFGYKINLGKK